MVLRKLQGRENTCTVLIEKQSTCKWVHAVQTRIVQDAPVNRSVVPTHCHSVLWGGHKAWFPAWPVYQTFSFIPALCQLCHEALLSGTGLSVLHLALSSWTTGTLLSILTFRCSKTSGWDLANAQENLAAFPATVVQLWKLSQGHLDPDFSQGMRMKLNSLAL